MSFAFCLFVYSFRANRLGFWVGAAFALGMVPFAKLQAAPSAAVIGCFVLARAITVGLERGVKPAVRNAAAVVGAAVLPAVVFLLPVFSAAGSTIFSKRISLMCQCA